jgi:hypothetical protein
MGLELSEAGYPLKKINLSWCASWRGVRGVVEKTVPDCCRRASSNFASAGPYSSHECFQELRLQLPARVGDPGELFEDGSNRDEGG